jgi:hypothetical protein
MLVVRPVRMVPIQPWPLLRLPGLAGYQMSRSVHEEPVLVDHDAVGAQRILRERGEARAVAQGREIDDDLHLSRRAATSHGHNLPAAADRRPTGLPSGTLEGTVALAR